MAQEYPRKAISMLHTLEKPLKSLFTSRKAHRDPWLNILYETKLSRGNVLIDLYNFPTLSIHCKRK